MGLSIRFFVSFVFWVNLVVAQELPPIRNFSPKQYDAENQNWAIDQSKEQYIYSANNSGLLEFNGASWNLYSLPNQTIIRSVKAVADRIYTGSYRDFGYWKRNVFGRLEYTSLAEKIKDTLLEDEEFWSIAALEGKVFFQSKKRIYSYDLEKKSFDYIAMETSLPRIFNTDSGVYVQETGLGLSQIRGGQSELRYSSEIFKNDEIINVFSVGKELLILTRQNGFYKTAGSSITKWKVPIDDLLKANSIYCAKLLADGSFALGTVSDGLLVIDKIGNLEMTINQVQGLRNNTVLSLNEDKEGNLWLGLDNGVSCVNRNSPFKVYNDFKGLIGSVYAAAEISGNLYLGTNQGLYYRGLTGKESFTLIGGTEGQVWSLQQHGNVLFCGHHSGTFVVKGEKAKKIANIPGTWQIQPFSNRDNVFLQGNYTGLYVLEGNGEDWEIKHKIHGFDNSSRYFEVLGNTIFVNHEYKGVFQLKVNADFTKVIQLKRHLLEPGFNSGIQRFKDKLLYAHKLGVLQYNQKDEAFEKDTSLSKVFNQENYISGKMVVDPKNKWLWLFTRTGISKVYGGKLSEQFLVKEIAIDDNGRNGIHGYENISPIGDNSFLLGSSTGYILLNMDKMNITDFEVQINGMQKFSKGKEEQTLDYLNLSKPQTLPYNENSLAFSYATSVYQKFNIPKYQYRLKGSYPVWSNWLEEPSVTFENLSYGDYVFEVRSKVGDQVSQNTANISFTIEKPFYLSNLALLLYGIGSLLGAIAIHGSYRRYYLSRQKALIEQNQKEMQLAKAQNEKEIIKIKNEQLKEEFRNKSNELAASTLSIIRKNELLTKVKEELIASDETRAHAKPIIDIIDKNLRKNDDWELFKEAFNNADRKFLKKLGKSHPQLTPNDIRLCAYLRLNLSSKEIAPLLGISPRSVEIKRYRLRKKMNLTHDENLVEYILTL